MQENKTEELSTEQKIGECLKVIKSFQYFLDEYVYIEDKEAHTAIKLHLWPEQTKIIPAITDSTLLLILKARQLGLTWLVAAYTLWLLLTKPLYLAVIISTTEELSIEFLERVYFVLDRLPFWLKPPTKSRTKQVFELQHGNGLVSTIKSLPTTEMGAQSKTPNLLIMDETCKNRMAKSIYNASYPGIEAAKGQVIIVSNAIKEGAGWYFTRDLYIESMRGMNKFKRIFLPWNAHPLRPQDFKKNMIAAGMEERDVNENYPENEEEAITDRNIKGVYYAKQMADARKEGRICAVPYVAGHEVYTFWDLGIDDATSIWFMQQIGKEFRFIDYYENTGMGQVHYAKILKEKEYVYGDHYMPHDVEKREMGGDTDIALSIKEISENLGIKPILTVKKAKDSQAVLNSIELGRNILGQCCFDARKCAKGILCLESYRAEWDEEKDKLDIKPLRNFACLAGDTFIRTLSGWIKIEELVNKEFYVWGYSLSEHRLLPVKAEKCWQTKITSDLVRIHLDSGKFITCTSDHLFLTRDEQWVQACNLKPKQSLMPFYEKDMTKEAYYNKVYLNDGSIAEEHKFVYNRLCNPSFYDSSMHIHHIDGNRRNNNPWNLQALSIQEHMSYHSKTPERLAKLRKNSCKVGNEKATNILIAVNKLRSGDNHHTRKKDYWTQNIKDRMSKGSVQSWKNSETIKTCIGCGNNFMGNWKRLYCCNQCKSYSRHSGHYSVSEPHDTSCKITNSFNHKVICVEHINQEIPVYDIHVPELHSFAANGVIVHNCHGADSFRSFAAGYKSKAEIISYEKLNKDYGYSNNLAYLSR